MRIVILSIGKTRPLRVTNRRAGHRTAERDNVIAPAERRAALQSSIGRIDKYLRIKFGIIRNIYIKLYPTLFTGFISSVKVIHCVHHRP